MSEITAEELFGKGMDGNLSKKSLREASKKERIEIVESNLPFLVEWYFGRGQNKDFNKLNLCYEIIGSDRFLEAFGKVLKDSLKKKKKKSEYEEETIPEGMHLLFVDYLTKIGQMLNQKISKFQNHTNDGSNLSEYGREAIRATKEAVNEQRQVIEEMISAMTKKESKKLQKMGIAGPYAERLARCFVPKKYLNEHNVRRYFNNLNREMVNVVRHGVVKDENDPDSYVNNVGINLCKDENIIDLYEMFFKKCDRETFLAALKEFLLEPRTRQMDNWSKPQLEIFNAMNRVICEVLEGEQVINTTGRDLKRKEKKDLVVTKKELKKVLKGYAQKRMKDNREGRDCARRILFKSLNEETYPRLTGSFAKMLKVSISMDEDDRAIRAEKAEDERRKQQNQQKNNNGQNNNNQRNNNRRN